jgi:hypothetical protein
LSGKESPYKKKPTTKAGLNQGRTRIDPFKMRSMSANRSPGTQNSFSEDEEEPQSFQISVSIGGEKK